MNTHLPNLRSTSHARRGNTLILVVGILVLLVIIATAYISRTQAGLSSSGAMQDVKMRADRMTSIALDLAQIPADALFVREIIGDLSAPNANTTDPDRNPILPYAVRYGVDPNYPFNYAPFSVYAWTNPPDPNPNIIPQDNSNQFWISPSYPRTTFYSPYGRDLVSAFSIGYANPLGGPGFSDHRWLRSFEPYRWDTGWDLEDNNPNPDYRPDAFSHWLHLSYIATNLNGYRHCIDVANCNANNVLTRDLRVPIEQWLPIIPDPANLVAGNTFAAGNHRYPGDFPFWSNWNSWVSLNDYPAVSADPDRTPNNYYNLRDLNGNGIAGEIGERPEDEFIPGTMRNNVSRVLADTDGDGFTDAFWFLAPTPIESGIRQVLAVSIIDASAMINANTASRFQRTGNDPASVTAATLYNGFRTRGIIPSDVALVGNLGTGDTGIDPNHGFWNVGFFDAPENANHFNFIGNDQFDFSTSNWSGRIVPEIESRSGTLRLSDPTARARLEYWQNSGRFGPGNVAGVGYANPYGAGIVNPFSPFSLSDDLELRMYAGCNYPWIGSRFENAVQPTTTAGSDNGLLRATIPQEENSEFLDQPVNRLSVLDQRHRITMYNGARNDLMAPWLWLRRDWADANFNVLNTEAVPTDLPAWYPHDGNNFYSNLDRQYLRRLKIDLRASVRPNPAQPNTKGTDFNHDGQVTADDRLYLRDVLFRCLVDREIAGADYNNDTLVNTDDVPSQSYFGPIASGSTDPKLLLTHDAAAAFAANIIAYADNDDLAVAQNDLYPATFDVTPDDAAPIAIGADPNNPTTGFFAPVPSLSDTTGHTFFLGMEPQPFLVEAMVIHDYEAVDVPPAYNDPDVGPIPFLDAGNKVILDIPAQQKTIVAIQIANPFDVPINLNHYQLRVFGNIVNIESLGLADSFLKPAKDHIPATAIFYAVGEGAPGEITSALPVPPATFGQKWLKFLDIDTTEFAPDTRIINLSGILPDKRDDFDSYTGNNAIAIERIYDQNVTIVVDRFDPNTPAAARQFANAVNDLDNVRPEAPPNPADISDVPITVPSDYPIGIKIGPAALGYNHFAQWIRVTRAWGADPEFQTNGTYAYNKRNPRYVFGDRAVVLPAALPANTLPPNDPSVDQDRTFYPANSGYRYKFDLDPDNIHGVPNPGPYTPWFNRPYIQLNNLQALDKPAFFNLRWNTTVSADPAAVLPDKGWYGQKPGTAGDAGSVDDLVNAGTNLRLNFSMQMLQKDADFEQVGELANVWMFGHKIQLDPAAVGPRPTLQTFSEYLANPALTGDDLYVNRLRPAPNTGADAIGQYVGTPPASGATVSDLDHLVPDLPAGLRVYDAFVCDGRGMGVNNINNNVSQFYNANNFDRRITPGLINIATAPLEVMRALPHFYRLIWNRNDAGANASNPRTLIADAVVQYREKFNGLQDPPLIANAFSTGFEFGPDYKSRAGDLGIRSIGELLSINLPAAQQLTSLAPTTPFTFFTDLWRIDAPALDPLELTIPAVIAGGSYLSTDVVGKNDTLSSANVFGPQQQHSEYGDAVSADSEEANLLFAGVSNLVSTRSDVFIIYFKVRSFRIDNSVSPPVWNATNLENIIDDSRYVMLVDRSSVNAPGDKPKILYLEKLPN